MGDGMAKKKQKSGKKTYEVIAKHYPKVIKAVEALGTTVRGAGPLDEKTSHLIQLAAAAATGSEGAVHSHTRRAKKAGATPEEIVHALLMLISTIGFPQAMAALSWSRDILDAEEKEKEKE
jgi:4-carboxymuconolactone decarboxylase